MRLLSLFLIFLLSSCDESVDKTPKSMGMDSTEMKEEPAHQESSSQIPKDKFLIRYDHSHDGKTISATASNMDGNFKVTVTRNGVDSSRELSHEAFSSLWDGINEIDDIKSNALSDPNTALDKSKNHLIGIMYSTGGQQGVHTYSVPSGGCSKKFLDWVSKLTES